MRRTPHTSRPPARFFSYAESGGGPAGALTTAEREELAGLRKRVKTLEMEREILKKATAFFAKESK